METKRVFRLEHRPQEFLPTSLNCIQFQHLHLICRLAVPFVADAKLM